MILRGGVHILLLVVIAGCGQAARVRPEMDPQELARLDEAAKEYNSLIQVAKKAKPGAERIAVLRSGIEISGRRAAVVGRSSIVGRPMAFLLMEHHATVTMCHSRTRPLGDVTKEADILCAAVGVAGLIKGDMVKPGAVVVDFGVNFVDGKMCGDVDFESVAEVASLITPVPGGTGPMTNAMLMRNVLESARNLVSS